MLLMEIYLLWIWIVRSAEKRYDPQDEYYGVVCLGFDYERRAYGYKVYSGEQLEDFSYNKTQDFFESLEVRFFDLD